MRQRERLERQIGSGHEERENGHAKGTNTRNLTSGDRWRKSERQMEGRRKEKMTTDNTI